MRKRKNGGNGYSKERSDKIHKTKVEKYGEDYARVAYEKGKETCELHTTLKSDGFLFSLQRLNLHNQLTSNRLCSD